MVQQLDLGGVGARQFWQQFIARRQPVVINGVDKQWSAFTDGFLISTAGDVRVMVEQRSNSKDTYGQGRKSPMQFRDLVRAVQQGDSSLYMSTQEVGVGHDGHPLLLGPPLIQLSDHFPQQQHIMGHLVPQSINMWMGCAVQGSSSGLHHDYHDNLYVLLRGRKRFRLYPPDAAPDMYVRGRLKKIYHNGRIVYEGQGDILPDGSDAHDVRLWEARHTADAAAAAADDDADDLLEQQLEAMLDEEAGCSDEEGLQDDYVDSGDLDTDSASDDDDDDDVGLVSRKASAGRKINKGSKSKGIPPKTSANASQGNTVEPPPPSFSQIDLSLPESELRRRFPRFPGVAAAQEVVLQAGQMLYLPAGWFHEVTSFGQGGPDGGHLAINYWYHPPDNLDTSTAGFKQPYKSPYYPTVWAQRQPWLQQETQRWWQQQQQKHQLQPHTQGDCQQPAGTSQPAAAEAEKRLQPLRTAIAHEERENGQRHIHWVDEVHSPTNKYSMGMTRKGTATGSVTITPLIRQSKDRPAYGVISSLEPDSGDDAESPCTSTDDKATAAADTQHSHRRSMKQQQLLQRKRQHADAAELLLMDEGASHVGVPLLSGAQTLADSDDELPVKSKQQRKRRKQQQQQPVDQDSGQQKEDEEDLSEDVLAGIQAVEDYFSGNPEAARQLLAEFMAQRRQRLGQAGRRNGGMLALPRLFGRRHHYTVSMKVVPRKPAKR